MTSLLWRIGSLYSTRSKLLHILLCKVSVLFVTTLVKSSARTTETLCINPAYNYIER
jgi:hypothetical protein